MEFQSAMTLVVLYRISIVLASVIFAWLGYRLLSEGLTLREGEIQLKLGKFQAKAAKVTSGSLFSLCGMGVLITSLFYPITIRVKNPAVEIIAKGGELGPGPTAKLMEERQRLAARLSRPRVWARTQELPDIHFDSDSYDIRPGDATILDKAVQWMKEHPNYDILIEGHTDDRGANEYNEYNLALGERRAKSMRDYLVSRGVSTHRLTMISYGEERPLCGERTEKCWSKNRRVTFLVK